MEVDKFDFVTGGPVKKSNFYSCRILRFFSRFFVFLFHISLRSSLSAIFFFPKKSELKASYWP